MHSMLLSRSQIPQMRQAPGAASMHIMLLWNAMDHVAARKPGWWPNATCLKKLTVDAPRLSEISCGSKQLADSFADRIVVGSMAVVSKGPQERQLSIRRQCDLQTNLLALFDPEETSGKVWSDSNSELEMGGHWQGVC